MVCTPVLGSFQNTSFMFRVITQLGDVLNVIAGPDVRSQRKWNRQGDNGGRSKQQILPGAFKLEVHEVHQHAKRFGNGYGEDDCTWHGVWGCPAFADKRKEVFREDTIAAALAAGRDDVRYARGLFSTLVVDEERERPIPEDMVYERAA